MKCIITLAGASPNPSSLYELVGIRTVTLDWDEIPEDIKKYIKDMIDFKMRNKNENPPQD